MTAGVDRVGVACCGNCGSQLEVRCKGGCPEPDAVFKDDYIASLKKPRGDEQPQRKERVLSAPKVRRSPTLCKCGEPVAVRHGRGRPPTKCLKHLGPSRAKVAA